MEEAREYPALNEMAGNKLYAVALGVFVLALTATRAVFWLKDSRDGLRQVPDFKDRDRWDANSGFASPRIFWFSIVCNFVFGLGLIVLGIFVA